MRVSYSAQEWAAKASLRTKLQRAEILCGCVGVHTCACMCVYTCSCMCVQEREGDRNKRHIHINVCDYL